MLKVQEQKSQSLEHSALGTRRVVVGDPLRICACCLGLEPGTEDKMTLWQDLEGTTDADKCINLDYSISTAPFCQQTEPI